MGPGWGEEMFKGLVTGVLVLLVCVGGCGIGVGYLLHGCDGPPRIEWRRK